MHRDDFRFAITSALGECWRARMYVPVLVISVAVIAACGPGKPTGAEYLGKWHLATTCWTGSSANCVFEISKNGESFVIRTTLDECAQSCQGHEGIFTLTPEGNLTGGAPPFGATVSYDKAKGQIIFSRGGDLEYLTKTQ